MKKKTFLDYARSYTAKNLRKSKEYKKFNDNDFYHITKFTEYLYKEYNKNKIAREKSRRIIRKWAEKYNR